MRLTKWGALPFWRHIWSPMGIASILMAIRRKRRSCGFEIRRPFGVYRFGCGLSDTMRGFSSTG